MANIFVVGCVREEEEEAEVVDDDADADAEYTGPRPVVATESLNISGFIKFIFMDDVDNTSIDLCFFRMNL